MPAIKNSPPQFNNELFLSKIGKKYIQFFWECANVQEFIKLFFQFCETKKIVILRDLLIFVFGLHPELLQKCILFSLL